MGRCGGPALVREDRAGLAAGGPVVRQRAPPGSRAGQGEPLTASKREARPKMNAPAARAGKTPRRRRGGEAPGARPATGAAEGCSWSRALPPPTSARTRARAGRSRPTSRAPHTVTTTIAAGHTGTPPWAARPLPATTSRQTAPLQTERGRLRCPRVGASRPAPPGGAPRARQRVAGAAALGHGGGDRAELGREQAEAAPALGVLDRVAAPGRGGHRVVRGGGLRRARGDR